VCDQHNDGDDNTNASNDGVEIQGKFDYHEPNIYLLRGEIVKIKGTRSTPYHSIEKNYLHLLHYNYPSSK